MNISQANMEKSQVNIEKKLSDLLELMKMKNNNVTTNNNDNDINERNNNNSSSSSSIVYNTPASSFKETKKHGVKYGN